MLSNKLTTDREDAEMLSCPMHPARAQPPTPNDTFLFARRHKTARAKLVCKKGTNQSLRIRRELREVLTATRPRKIIWDQRESRWEGGDRRAEGELFMAQHQHDCTSTRAGDGRTDGRTTNCANELLPAAAAAASNLVPCLP